MGEFLALFCYQFSGFFIFRLRKNVKDSTETRISSLPSDLCRYFLLTEILVATNNFDEVFIIGVGGFSNVYKGYIDDGATPVVIKRLNPGSQQGAHEFKTQIEMLSAPPPQSRLSYLLLQRLG